MFYKEFEKWFCETDLHSLNNHDKIAIGFIMKKYIRIFDNHLNFWKRFLEETANTNFNKGIEQQRINLIYENLK